MAKKILSPDEMNEARRLYEREGWGYGRIATKFSVSKPTVQGWAKNWQREYGVAPLPAGKKVEEGKGAAGEGAKFTGNSVASPSQRGYSYPGATENRTPAAAPAGDAEPTPTPDSWAFKIAEPPADLTPTLRRDWVRRECEILAQKMGSRHELELRTLQNAFATEMTKGDAKERGPALRLKALTEATEKRHAMQRAGLIDFTKQRMGEFAGMPSTGIVFVVHLVPGMSFDRDPPEPVAGTKLVEVGSHDEALDVARHGDVVDVEAKEVQ
ncbi:helix-turn-helix domain-containing protein [Paraburkholderia sediminicola]|uniref:helix-turn-helix domain-containing protein n=1 Tax=Paraburkholderia sediminicola TaxID=458836 RepID=UPI0038B8C9B7